MLLISALVSILILLIAYQNHLKKIQQRNTLNAVIQVVEQHIVPDPYKSPRLIDADILFGEWGQMSKRAKARVRQSLNLNVLAMLEHERVGQFRYTARRLDRAAGLGGPSWTTSSPYSSRQTPR